MKNESNDKQTSSPIPRKFWFQSPVFLILAMMLCQILWLAGINFVSQQLDVKPNLLVLKSEGCSYLQSHHIQTMPYKIEHTCSAEVRMTATGKIYISDDVSIFVNENQIIATESLPDRPWTPRQHRLAMYLGIGTLVFFSIMGLILIVF